MSFMISDPWEHFSFYERYARPVLEDTRREMEEDPARRSTILKDAEQRILQVLNTHRDGPRLR